MVFAITSLVCADDIQFYLFRKYQGRTAASVPPKKRDIAVPNVKVAVVKFIVSSIGLNYIVIMYHSDTKVCHNRY